jgi:hypothetical protein
MESPINSLENPKQAPKILANKTPNKIILIIIAAFSGGIAWRVRGDFGWGGMSGMCVVSTLLTLLIFMVYGNRKKLDGSLISFIIVFMIFTANGYGTLNGQITGLFTWSVDHIEYEIVVSPLSGIFAMFLVGFGWVPLWAILMGFYLSDKKYEPKSNFFLKSIVIYLLFRALSELVLAHLIIPLIAHNAYVLYETNLTGITPWLDYITHWNNDSYFDSIVGGRNYAAMVTNLSSCIGGVGSFLFMRFKVKDKFASKLMITICFIFGISITVADLWRFVELGGYHHSQFIAPDWVLGWTYWEYSTGFLVGGLTMFIILRWVKPITTGAAKLEDYDTFHLIIPQKYKAFISFVCTVFFLNIFAWISPLGNRLVESNPEVPPIIETLVIALISIPLIVGWILLRLGKIKNPFFKSDYSTEKTFFIGFMLYFTLYSLIYIVGGNLYSWNNPMNYIMVISIGIILVMFFILKSSAKRNLTH